MINNRIYQKLEYNLILEDIAKYASNESSKSYILKMQHAIFYEEVKQLLNETDEVMRLSNDYQRLYFDDFLDVKDDIISLNNKINLDGLKIVNIVKQNKSINFLKEFFKEIDNKERYPQIKDWITNLKSINNIEKEVMTKLDETGLVYEDATANLKRINVSIRELNEQIQSYLRNFINNNSEHLMDTIITTRNNRYVIMVKLSSKNIIKGIIHDESSSKQTIFIEPTHVVEMNNKIQSLEFEKLEEIKIVLNELTLKLYENKEILLTNYDILEYFDVVNAKALYCLNNNNIIPSLNKDSAKLEIYQGRHPLIDKDKVVSNDFFLCNNDSKYRIVLISGSNTGGKSVALKMVGLFSIMVQSGIGIPANEKSNFPIYSQIFVDIGDEQSIVSSLSTFSSHLSNVIDICNNVSEYSLVLLDELGSGTDPREGENLALAILEYLYYKDASIIVTTHYSKLKNYAITTDYVRSASVSFNEQSKLPEYKLVFDTFASSNAFEIASSLGLNKDIVKQAIAKYHEDLATSDELLLQLQALSQEYQLKEQDLKDKENALALEKINLNKEKDSIKDRKEKILLQAHEEANKLIQEQKQKAHEIINKLKKEDKFINHQVNKYNKELDDLIFNENYKIDNTNITFKVGDVVKVLKINSNGTIKKVLKNNQYEVLSGNISMKVKHDEISFIQHQAIQSKNEIKTKKLVSKSMSSEINLIGLKVEEARRILNKFLDDAIVAKLNKVRIIHGFGTGALRKMVHEELRKNKHVKDFMFATYQEGGQGATIANFK
ncbi:MAG: endonuclease MutS2 [Bacilli bacterium]|jgi:DNA mismatch repair protein MutS2|nr:endonuclease MutS2 [Bacilli bacterium]